MNDLDAMLSRLAQAPTPAGLDALEAKVLARIAARPMTSIGMGFGAMTIAVALGMGVLGAGVHAREVSTMSPLFPLGPVSPLAPSTLLLGGL